LIDLYLKRFYLLFKRGNNVNLCRVGLVLSFGLSRPITQVITNPFVWLIIDAS